MAVLSQSLPTSVVWPRLFHVWHTLGRVALCCPPRRNPALPRLHSVRLVTEAGDVLTPEVQAERSKGGKGPPEEMGQGEARREVRVGRQTDQVEF